MEFCIYLVEDGCAATDAVVPEAGTPLPISIAGDYGDLWIFPKDPTPPDWVTTVSAAWPGADLSEVLSARGGAVAAVQAANRTFLLTFGTGYLRVNKDRVARDFGRRTVVNCVNQGQLRSISRQAMEGSYLQAIEQTPKSANIGVYGIDVDRDLLKGLAGVPRKRAFGEFLAGSDSLRGRIIGGLDELLGVLRLYLRAYRQKKILADDLKWIDRLKKETNASVVHALEQKLDAKIQGASVGGEVMLLLPEHLDLSSTPRFSFEQIGKVAAPAIFNDPSLDEWVTWRAAHKKKPASYSVARVERIYVHVGGVNNKVSYPIARCIGWITVHSGATYLLHDATWYRVDQDFVKDLSVSLRSIYRSRSGVAWPKYTGGSEGAYNVDAVKALSPSSLELLDKSNIILPGARTAVEPCDLFDPRARMLVYVKRKKAGSEGLGHLLMQALVGVEAFMSHDVTMRNAIHAKLPQPTIFSVDSQVDPSKWTVVILICGVGAKRGIPFLTNIALRRVVAQLKMRYGLKVCVEYA